MFESLFVAAVLGAGGAPATVPNPTVAPAPRAVPVLTAAYHLRNAAAADAATAVGAALGTRREIRVGFRGAENHLVVTGSPATHALVAELVGEIDRTVPQVVVQTLIAEVPVAFLADCGLTESGDAGGPGCFSLKGRELALFHTAFRNYPGREVLSRPLIQTCDNQTGYVAVGQNIPVGTPVVPAGAVVPVGTQFVGVSLRVTPRIMPEGKILLRVEPQLSALAATPVVVRAGATAFPINVQTVQTTVLVPDGETVVLVGPGAGGSGKPTALLMVLTPSVVRTAPW